MRPALRLALLTLLLSSPLPLRADRLLAVAGATPAQLAGIADAGLQVRFYSGRVALLEDGAAARRVLQRLGLTPSVADLGGPDEGYYLTNELLLPPVPPLTVVYRDPSGWALVRLPRSRLSAVLDRQPFLWPLPESFRLDGWREPRPRAKPVAALAGDALAELLARVDTTRLRLDVRALALLDPAGPGAPANLRTRYARRPEVRQAAEYIRGQLAAVLGDSAVRLEEFRFAATEPVMYNVVGVLPGSAPAAGYYVVSAHYDAIAARSAGWDWRTDPAPGADDNAGGVALVLEAARLLAGQRFPWSVEFTLFCAEELGLWGSRHHAALAAARDDRILGVLNFDMVGFNDLSRRLELVTNPGSRWLVEQMVAAEARYQIGLRLDVLEDDYATLSDHSPFWARGYDAILGIENYLPTDSTTSGVRQGRYRINTQYHTLLDLPDSLNWDLVGRVTRLAVATLAQYTEEVGLPDLAVFAGDVSEDPEEQLRVRISNLGRVPFEGPYGLRISRCGADSTDCEPFFEQELTGRLPAGGAAELSLPWGRFGAMAFLVEVDPGQRIAEADEANNRAVSRTRFVPRARVVVFPSPFRPARDQALRFMGVPLGAEVRIYGPTGALVWAAREDDSRQRRIGAQPNEVVWLGVNGSGDSDERAPLVAGGVYFYTIRSQAGELLRRDRIAVVR